MLGQGRPNRGTQGSVGRPRLPLRFATVFSTAAIGVRAGVDAAFRACRFAPTSRKFASFATWMVSTCVAVLAAGADEPDSLGKNLINRLGSPFRQTLAEKPGEPMPATAATAASAAAATAAGADRTAATPTATPTGAPTGTPTAGRSGTSSTGRSSLPMSDPTGGTPAARVAAATTLPTEPPADEIDLGLRVTWGGGPARAWQGEVRMLSGSLGDVVNLGREADEPGSLDVHDDSVQVVQTSPSNFGGLDVRVRGSLDASLAIELAPRDRPTEMRRLSVKLSDLINRPATLALDDSENRLHVTRSPGDRLRVSFDRPNLIFEPGETLDLRVLPNALAVDPSTTWRLRLWLTAGRAADELWSQELEVRSDEKGRFAGVGPIAIPAPDAEGVYDLQIALLPRRLPGGLTLTRSKPLHQRTMQIVVVSPIAPPSDRAKWQTVADFDPATGAWRVESGASRWSEWLRKMQPLASHGNVASGGISNLKTTRLDHDGRPLLALAPTGWIAYPLPVKKLNEPHILEIEYPSDLRQTMGISVLEPNAAGQVIPLGLDSGIDVPALRPGQPAGWLRHRLVYWPRTTNPALLLVNRREDEQAVFGRLTVSSGPTRLPPPDLVGNSGPDQRLVAALLDRPMFPELFGADEALDSDGRSVWDDWVTFHQGAQRLVDYLKFAGYNAAVISVACEGSSIYPSDCLEPTPKYDTGIYLSNGNDPIRKDVLELLFRLFDREGLTLIPAMQFAAPLRELESLRRQGGEAAQGLEWIGADGQTWLAVFHPNRGLAPYYNSLDPRVQNAMTRAVEELSDRYGHHVSFGGMSLQLGPDTYSQLPGIAWGLDDRTVDRFMDETGIQVPGRGPGRFAERARYVTGDGRQRWLAWRSRTMAEFYGRLAEQLAAQRPESRLYLSAADMLTSVPWQQQLRPALPARSSPADALAAAGLDPAAISEQRGVVMLRPHRTAPLTSLASQGFQWEWSRQSEVDRLFQAGQVRGGQWFHEPLTLELPSFDSVSPFGVENTRVWMAAHIPPSGATNRQRLVRSLVANDAQIVVDGGWMLPLGQEDATRSVYATYRQLPAELFKAVVSRDSTSGQPVTVRSATRDGRTYVYVVNDAPWLVTAYVDLRMPKEVAITPLAGTPAPQIAIVGDDNRWLVTLQPYDMQAIAIAAPSAAIVDWKAETSRETIEALAVELQEVRARANQLRAPQPLAVPKNADFEAHVGHSPSQWLHARDAGITVHLDKDQPHGGERSLHLRSDKPVIWVRSEPIPTPATGRLALWVWLRTSNPDRQPPLRLAIEGRLHGKTYYRFATVGHGKATPLQTQWTQYWFQIDDLPTDGLTDLRVGFDLMGPGEVWVDDVQLFDLWFYDNERDELTKQIGLADFNLNNGRPRDCERFLDGYWARFLSQNVTRDDRIVRTPVRGPAGPAATPPDRPAEKTSWKDRMNGLFRKPR